LKLRGEKTEVFAGDSTNTGNKMPDSQSPADHRGRRDNLENASFELLYDEDLLMEQILENLNTTPLGQVLKKIAMLPEVRRDKVLKVRRQITDGSYNLNEGLDIALDRVLEELTT